MYFLDSPAVLERMKSAQGLKSDADLSQYLDVSEKDLEFWRKSNALPLDEMIRFARKNSVSLDWLILGVVSVERDNHLAIDEQMMLVAYNRMTPMQKMDAIGYMSGLKDKAEAEQSNQQTASSNGTNQIFNGDVTIEKN